MDEMKQFWCSSVDYIESNMEPGPVIHCMHQLTLLIMQNMGKYYPNKLIGMVLVQALKHCVGPLQIGRDMCARMWFKLCWTDANKVTHKHISRFPVLVPLGSP